MSRRHLTAAIAAVLLGLGTGACGDRENVEKSNPGEQIPEGSPSTVETGEGLTSTGEDEPSVTQEDSP